MKARWTGRSLADLTNILANLYPTGADWRRVAAGAGLDLLRIDFKDQALATWFSILEFANGRAMVDDVIAFALHENPDDESLASARNHRPPPALDGPAARWSGKPSAENFEKILGDKSTLVSIAYLQTGLERSRSVVRIRRADGSLGTGFVVDGGLLLTNSHVLPDVESARNAVVQFNYQLNGHGLHEPYEEVRLRPDVYFRTSHADADDWTAVRFEDRDLAKWGSIALKQAAVKPGDWVNIIQHPGGGPKQVSLSANIVAYVGGGRVQYLTDTLPGSSGSPVFDADWNLVALHHSGGWLREPNSPDWKTFFRNEGISVDVIIAGLA